MRYKTKKFLGSIEARVLPVSVAVLMIAVALSAVFVILPQDNTVKGASTTDFDNYVMITIDHTQVPATLSNFPVLVYNSSWVTGLNDTSFSFFQSDNSTECNWELVNYNLTSGELEAWVNITSVSSSSDTTFYLYYDSSSSSDGGENNPTLTWANGYVGVWHLSETGTGTRYDSSPSGVDMSGSAGLDADSGVAGGKVGSCCEFDGVDDWLDVTDPYDFNDTTPFSISLWCDPYSASTGNFMFAMAGNGGAFAVPFNVEKVWLSQSTVANDCTVYWVKSGSYLSNNTWYDLQTSYDGANTYDVYKNGSLNGSETWTLGTTPYTNDDVSIGSHADDYSGRAFEGKVDEVMVSNVARSSSWVNTWHNMMENQTTFVTFGVSGTPGVGSSFSLSGLDGNSRITWSGNAGETVWSNATSYGTLTIQTNISSIDNCTAIYLDIADFDSTIDADNISVEVRNTADGSWDGTTTALGSSPDYNLTIDKDSPSTWFHGTNPFPIDGTGWTNVTLEVHFKCAIPGDASAGTYVNTSSSWNVVWKVMS